MQGPSAMAALTLTPDPAVDADVRKRLARLERQLDPDRQRRVRQRHVDVACWQTVSRPPVLLVPAWDNREQSLPLYTVAEAVADPAKMLHNQLCRGFGAVTDWIEIGDDRPLQIRADLGIGLVASVLGTGIEVVGDNPPWVHPLAAPDTVETAVERALDGLEISRAHERGWVPRAGAILDYYLSVLPEFPAVSRAVSLSLPDLQGPFDAAAMVWGSGIFLALLTRPELVERLLRAVAEIIVHLHGWWRARAGAELLPAGFSHQHGSVIRGNLLLRCDSNLMMSPEMYRDQVFVHDRAVLTAVGGGSYHSCGRWKQNIPLVMDAAQVGSLDFGSNQSHMNDIDEVYGWARTARKHLNLVAVTPDELQSGRAQDRFPTGATLQCEVGSTAAARKIMARVEKRQRA